MRGYHAARSRLDIELLRDHVIHTLGWFIRASCFNAELLLKVVTKTSLFEGTLTFRIRRRVCQSDHAVAQLLQMLEAFDDIWMCRHSHHRSFNLFEILGTNLNAFDRSDHLEQ